MPMHSEQADSGDSRDVRRATVRAHCDRHDRHTLDCAACIEAIRRSVQEAVNG